MNGSFRNGYALRRARRLLAGALLALGLLPGAARAQEVLVPGGWQLFEWLLGVGPVQGEGWTIAASERMRLRVTDAFVSGDAFDVFVNGTLRTSTPAVAGGTDTGAATGDAAWGDARLSHRELFLDPGQYTVTLAVRVAASGFDYGEGFLRLDRAPDDPPPVDVVPEPAIVTLVAGGLLAMAALIGRRRRIPVARG